MTNFNQIYAQIDTGSDLTWFQCIPCTKYYKQLNPISSTYSNIACGLDLESCSKLYSTSCSPDKNQLHLHLFLC
ncbi:eukaryotic aspartyl protease family protein, putative [Medicago truncatula]|uniref:Eukaryotic aspartyl protease family protein, putative n=1 Tax=Medicago truncatula TaxID=3880 RepID=G7K0L6_MEDTR|nr:eukaryotic aspartyl protease family protein, putative [Medicago truncatula]